MEKLKRLREERGLSQVKLAARADLNPATVNQIERGMRDASPGTLRKLADALEVSLYELMEEKETPKALAPLQLELGEQAGQEPDEGQRSLLALFDMQTSLMREASEYYGPRLDQLPEEDPPLEELESKHTWVLEFDTFCDLIERSINTQPFIEIAGPWVDRANEESTPPDIRRSVEAFQSAFNDLLVTRHSQAREWIRRQQERYPAYVEEGHSGFANYLHTSEAQLTKVRG
jgi:transcriptional regulator with XRE-family HTH domain